MITRFIAKFLAAAYCLFGVALLIAGTLISALALANSSILSALEPFAVFLLIGGVPLSAGVGLWQQKAWSKWLFVLIAGISCLPLFGILSRGVGLYQHYKNPEPGSYKILSQGEFLELFQQSVLEPFGLAIAALIAAAFTFFYFRPLPNPSIERTSPGEPGAASHVKR